MNTREWLSQNKSTLFVVVGMLAIFGTVAQLQSGQLQTSDAASTVLVGDEGVLWFEKNFNGSGSDTSWYEVRVQLSSTKSPITDARLVMNYDQNVISQIDVIDGPAFSAVESSTVDGRVIATSKGSFFGSGNWFTLKVYPANDVDAIRLDVDARASSIQYEDGGSVVVGTQTVELED